MSKLYIGTELLIPEVSNIATKAELADKQDVISDLSSIRSGASAGATAYQLPNDGIPSTDIADGVIPNVSSFITKAVDDLTNYYLKSETYTQAEVNTLIGGMSGFSYRIATSTSEVTDPASNVLYLIGPTGSGADKYEEYVYPNSTTGWTKIGDTSIDLSGYVTTSTTVNGHALSGNVSVTASDVGLGNVGNFKAVSTVASQGLSSTEQSNARANIGAGTSSFSGNYSDLSGAPTLGTASAKDVAVSGNASTTQVVMGNDTRLSDSRPASDVSSWAKASSKPSYSYSEISGTPSSLPANGGNADTVDNIHLLKISQTDYDNLTTKDPNTLYIIS